MVIRPPRGLRRVHVKPSRKNSHSMKIFRVLGLGLAIIILRSLMPAVWQALETTLVTFFQALQNVLAQTSDITTQGAGIWMAQ